MDLVLSIVLGLALVAGICYLLRKVKKLDIVERKEEREDGDY